MALGPSTSQDDLIAVTATPIDPVGVLGHVADAGSGAVVLFLGTVRDHSPGIDGVTHLEYEAYAGVVEAKIGVVVAEAREKWDVARVAAVHRTGDLAVGEVSVAVAVSSAHRPQAFEAARYVIDELKHRAPIWKKEHWPGGAEWVREDFPLPSRRGGVAAERAEGGTDDGEGSGRPGS
jgi:molybdopterin synthase catalytic subunit